MAFVFTMNSVRQSCYLLHTNRVGKITMTSDNRTIGRGKGVGVNWPRGVLEFIFILAQSSV